MSTYNPITIFHNLEPNLDCGYSSNNQNQLIKYIVDIFYLYTIYWFRRKRKETIKSAKSNESYNTDKLISFDNFVSS